MNCPNCGNEMAAFDIKTVYGIRGNVVEALVNEEVRLTTCCGVAFLSTVPKTEELIIPSDGIITPEEKHIILETD